MLKSEIEISWRHVISTVQNWRALPVGAATFLVKDNVLLAVDDELARLRAVVDAAVAWRMVNEDEDPLAVGYSPMWLDAERRMKEAIDTYREVTT